MFRFKALRTRHISCMLHLSEVRFTTRPVIPMDMDGLRWIPMDPIGFHSTNRYRWIPSDNISALYNFHLTSGTLSRQFRKQTSRKNLVTRLATNFKKHIKIFIEVSMIVIGKALHNFFFFKNLIPKSVYSDFKSTHAIGRNRLRKAEAVQVNLRSLDTRISNS